MSKRRYDVDGLRIFAIGAVYIFHCTRFFDTEQWHLKNAEQSEMLFISMRVLIWPWLMELFFLLSGVGAYFSLRSHTAQVYLWERAKRLFIPLYTVGAMILLPPQYYFEQATNHGFAGTFLDLLPEYFGEFYLPRLTSSPSHLIPLRFGGHLWFLQYLILITLITLPFLLWLKKKKRGQRLIEWIADRLDRSCGIFLFIIPLAIPLIGLRGLFQVHRGWADLVWYTVYYVIGFIMASTPQFTTSVRRNVWFCLPLWILGFSGVGYMVLGAQYNPLPGAESYSLRYVFYQVMWTTMSWSSVVFLLFMGSQFLSRKLKHHAYMNEAVLPFYLFHQTIILCVGSFILEWKAGIFTKLLTISILSVSVTIGLYELLVRRSNLLRFFFGMHKIVPQSKHV